MMYLFSFQLIAVALILSANTSNGFDLGSILRKPDAAIEADPIKESEVAPVVHEKKDEGNFCNLYMHGAKSSPYANALVDPLVILANEKSRVYRAADIDNRNNIQYF